MSWLRILVFQKVSRSLVIGVSLASCCCFQGCAQRGNYERIENANANSNANTTAANANPYMSPNPPQVALTREEYERDKERYERNAQSSSRQIGSGSEDRWIWVQAYYALTTKSEFNGTKINVDVDNSIVTLSGNVRTPKQKVQAVETIQKLEGVKGVNDHLRVQSVPASSQNFDIDRELKRLKEGTAITEVPTAMELGEVRKVVLTLSPDPAEGAKIVAEKEAEGERQSQSGATPKIESAPIRYAKLMEAKLIGQGFEIKPPPSERQPVTRNQPTVWSWDIKAVARGEQYLELTTNAIFETPGSEPKVRSVNTFSKVIKVNVSWATWWGLYWQWVIGITVTLVVGGLTTTWFVSKRNSP